MTDPYTPTLAEFSLTADEAAAVTEALQSAKPWDWAPAGAADQAALKAAKDRLLAFHLERHTWHCCYCRTNLKGAGPFMTDREHILPKGRAAFVGYSYAPWNLAAACKRCNIQFKGAGIGFVVNAASVAAFQASANYRFVHPNFDNWDTHLWRFDLQVNGQSLVIFRQAPGSAKAEYTYRFFDLEGLQVDSFDRAQNGAIADTVSGLAKQVRDLAAAFGQ